MPDGTKISNDKRYGVSVEVWSEKGFGNWAPIGKDGTFSIKAPSTQPGDNCTVRAEIDCHIIISACPQDMNDTCGGNPTDIQMEIGR